MRLPAGLAALAVLALALAGCSGGDAGAGDPAASDGTGPAERPEPQTQSFGFALGAAAGTPVVGGILPVDDSRTASFEVPAGYTRLVATAAWECDVAATCELEVELRRGEQNVQTAGFGASPVVLTLDRPEEGRYTFWAFPSGSGSVVVGMQGTLTVELS